MGTNLDIWFHALPRCQKMLIWQMAIIALVWSIWRMRIRVIFQRESFDEGSCFELCHFDLAWWVKTE